jgi:hypothetical protein
VRLSQNGIFYWRREMEDRRPDHRCSWMQIDPNDPDPRVFFTSGSGPSASAPCDLPHMPAYETYRPLRPDAPVFVPSIADPARRRLKH